MPWLLWLCLVLGEIRVELVDPPYTLTGIGAGQGVRVIDGRAYFYGDFDVGVVRETTIDHNGKVKATGRDIRLTCRGEDVLSHPTGLAYHPRIGCFIGSTVAQKGTIGHLDWDRAVRDGCLDHALLNTIEDDAAVNGTRPEFVRVGERWLIATSDYGNEGNHVRLYDPEKLKTVRRTTEPGVLIDQFPCDSFVQDLAWIDSHGLLVLVQNTTEGLGWRLTFIDLEQSLERRVAVVVDRVDLAPTDELEGFDVVDGNLAVMVSASATDNVRVARITLPKHRDGKMQRP